MAIRNGAAKQVTSEHDLQDQLTDLWQIVHRHLGLVITTLAILLALGTLYYFKAPRTFESETDLLIVTKRFSGFRQGEEERPAHERSIETHALMVQSPLIVGQAVARGDLASLPSLVDEEDPVQAIIENMKVTLTDEKATVLNVTYRAADPRDTRDVLQAISDAYRAHLGDASRQIGEETTRLITEANSLLVDQMKKNEQDYRAFQRTAPLMWRDGQGVNVHHERQSQIEAARQQLMVERTVLRARVDALDASLVQGGASRDAVYYEALSALNPEVDRMDWHAYKITEQEQLAEREAVREYASLLMGEYVRLIVEESQLVDEFGEGHPQLESLRKRQAEVKRLLNGLLTEETPALHGLLVKGLGSEQQTEKDYVTIFLQMLRDRLAILDQQIQRLDDEFQAEQKLANAMQEFLLQDQAFRSEREHTKQLFDEVVARLKEINLVHEFDGDTLSVLAPPQLGEQVAPRILYVAVASIFLGCLFGSTLAWAVDRSENTFRSSAEIRQALQVPVIGRIPHVKKRHQVASPNLPDVAPIVCTLHQEKSPVAEAYRGVRTSLFFSAAAQDLKIVQVTSPLPGDGKSTIAANLAVTIAKSGKRVLLMDADFRRPSLTKLLGTPQGCQHGLAAVIAGRADPLDAQMATEVPNLFFLPALERPLNPSELLSTPQFKNLLDVVRERFDMVLIDTPPLLAVSDPCVVAARADGVLLALRIRKGVQAVALRAMEMLSDIEAHVLGAVVNGVDGRAGFQETSGYRSYGTYVEDRTSGKSPRAARRSRHAPLTP